MGKSRRFRNELLKLGTWFDRQKRVLPWRSRPTLYRVWVSEIMLQQTQVVTVVPYFNRFMERFPTVDDLARASEEEVMRYWAGLGYYSRARNLHKAAKFLSQNGFPKDRDSWLEVPGVGPYTAGAILSISLNHAVPILDGNIERVASRLCRVSRDSNWKKRLWEISGELLEVGVAQSLKPSVINQALMELGATVCTPKQPKCQQCPIIKGCEAFKHQEVLNYPPKAPRKKWVKVSEERVLLLNPANEIWVEQSKEGQWRSGLWDLPVKLPVGISRNSVQEVATIETKHVVTKHRITRTTRVLRHGSKRKTLTAADKNSNGAWLKLGSDVLPTGAAYNKILKSLKKHLSLEE